LPDVHFYAYTKAWIRFSKDEDVADIEMTADEVNAINDEIMDVLKEINALPNFQILLSTDKTTGPVPRELLDEGFKEAGIDFAYAASKNRPPAKCLYQTTQEAHADEIDKRGVEELIKKGKIVTDIPMNELMDAIRNKKIRGLVEEHKIETTISAKEIRGEIRDTGMRVLIKEGKIYTCDRCGFCWDKSRYRDLNVFFKEH